MRTKKLVSIRIEVKSTIVVRDQENIVRGRLLENVIIGTDKGVMAVKQLGADKRISMWRPESQVGMVILSPPPIPKIDHEVPWIESKGATMLRAKSHGEPEPLEGDTSPDMSESPETAPGEAWEEEDWKAEK